MVRHAGDNRLADVTGQLTAPVTLPPPPAWGWRGPLILTAPDTPRAVWGRDTDVLWARGEGLLIYGPDGTGKTTLAGNLLRALLAVDGEYSEVLGLPVTPLRPGTRALYLAMDRPYQAARRLRQALAGATEDQLARLHLWHGPPGADLARDAG